MKKLEQAIIKQRNVKVELETQIKTKQEMEFTAKQANDEIYAKLKQAEQELRANRKKEIEEKTKEIVRQAEAELAVHKSKSLYFEFSHE